MQTKREIGFDVLKVVACCLVVASHTIRADFGFVNFVVFALAIIAIPLFIMVNGYLMFQKAEVTYAYVRKKIIRILVVCFSWEALHAVAYFLYYHQFRNFLESFLLDFLQKGLFFQFWFMGSLIVLYLLLPILRWFYEKNAVLYIGILAALGVLCAIISIIMTVTKNLFVLEVPQSLRLWYWIFYYMLGGLLAKRKTKIQTLVSRCSFAVKIIIPTAAILLLISWQWLIGNVVLKQYRLETFYGSIPIMAAVTIIFVYVSNAKFQRGKTITGLAGLSMGIYVIHPFVLAVFQKYVPAFVSGNAAMNLLFWIVTVIACGIITAIINKIPMVKELIRL